MSGNNGTEQKADSVDDLFSEGEGAKGVVIGDRPMPTPMARNLEQEVSSEMTNDDYEEEMTGGYSPEAHRETLEKVKQARRDRYSLEQKADDYWANHDKQVAQTLGIAPGKTMAFVYKLVGKFGVNLYKRDAKKAIKDLRGKIVDIRGEVNKHRARLEGNAKYKSPTNEQNTEEWLKQKKSVAQEDKGLKYQLAEVTDETRMLGFQYRNGLRAEKEYRDSIANIETKVENLEKSDDPTAPAKISQLQTKLRKKLLEQEGLLEEQQEYEVDIKTGKRTIDRYQAKVRFYEWVIKKGNKKINKIENAIAILDDYIREGDEMISIDRLLSNLKSLDDDAKRVHKTIGEYDKVAGDQIDKLNQMVDSDDFQYSERPLMKKVDKLTKEESIYSRKEMGKILGDLGIPL